MLTIRVLNNTLFTQIIQNNSDNIIEYMKPMETKFITVAQSNTNPIEVEFNYTILVSVG